MNELHCKLFVDTWLSIEELTHELSNRLNLKYDKFLSIESELFYMDVLRNKEFDKIESLKFPDGFLYFPYMIDIDVNDDIELDNNQILEYKNIISKVMSYLWEQGAKLVASSDFESELPNSGGYGKKINY